MDGGEAGCIGKIDLSEREVAPAIPGAADHLQSQVKLQQYVSETLIGATLAKIEGPFALHGRSYKLVPPERLRNARPLGSESVHLLRSDRCDLQPGDRADAVIHVPQDVDIDVAKIARDEQSNDLPLPVRQLLVPAGPAVEDEVDITRLVTLGDEIAARVHEMKITGDVLKRGTIIR
jgi:hypothetical protein